MTDPEEKRDERDQQGRRNDHVEHAPAGDGRNVEAEPSKIGENHPLSLRLPQRAPGDIGVHALEEAVDRIDELLLPVGETQLQIELRVSLPDVAQILLEGGERGLRQRIAAAPLEVEQLEKERRPRPLVFERALEGVEILQQLFPQAARNGFENARRRFVVRIFEDADRAHDPGRHEKELVHAAPEAPLDDHQPFDVRVRHEADENERHEKRPRLGEIRLRRAGKQVGDLRTGQDQQRVQQHGAAQIDEPRSLVGAPGEQILNRLDRMRQRLLIGKRRLVEALPGVAEDNKRADGGINQLNSIHDLSPLEKWERGLVRLRPYSGTDVQLLQSLRRKSPAA